MSGQHRRRRPPGVAADNAQHLWTALAACPALDAPSTWRDDVWLAVQRAICTRTAVEVSPVGSNARVRVSRDDATQELLAAMAWLHGHEAHARRLDAFDLFRTLRGVATRGPAGSARAAQADQLHGMTAVPAGRTLQWRSLDTEDSRWE